MVDAAEAHRRGQLDAGGGGGFRAGDARTVPVRNTTDIDIPRLGLVGLGEPVFTPEAGVDTPPEGLLQLAFRGTLPTSPGRFAIAAGPIAAGDTGRGVVAGVTVAKVYMLDESHRCADVPAIDDGTSSSGPGVDPATLVLHSCDGGSASILWVEAGLGLKWAVVDVRPASRHRIRAILGKAHPVDGDRFRWLYEWHEAVLDGDPESVSYRTWVPREGGLSSLGIDDEEDPTRRALNRHESHHATSHEQPDPGIDGHVAVPVCGVPGAGEACPPETEARPSLLPIPEGVCVELTAERDSRGGTCWSFEALNGISIFSGEARYFLTIPPEPTP
jgi:hypothetical protein